jgi:hypothetical protein
MADDTTQSPPMRDRLRRERSSESPLSTVDDATFHAVEAELLAQHERELGGPPDDTNPRSIGLHLRWWSKVTPSGEVDYANGRNVVLHMLSFAANRRLLQRLDAFSAEERQLAIDTMTTREPQAAAAAVVV